MGRPLSAAPVVAYLSLIVKYIQKQEYTKPTLLLPLVFMSFI